MLSRLFLISLLATACTDATTESIQLPQSTTPNLTLYVSNQSFDKELVDIRVRIDGQLAVSRDFHVEGQHSWHAFHYDLPAGDHAIEVTSTDSTATLEVPLQLTGRRFGIISFWYDADDVEQPEHFGWSVSDVEPQFQ